MAENAQNNVIVTEVVVESVPKTSKSEDGQENDGSDSSIASNDVEFNLQYVSSDIKKQLNKCEQAFVKQLDKKSTPKVNAKKSNFFDKIEVIELDLSKDNETQNPKITFSDQPIAGDYDFSRSTPQSRKLGIFSWFFVAVLFILIFGLSASLTVFYTKGRRIYAPYNNTKEYYMGLYNMTEEQFEIEINGNRSVERQTYPWNPYLWLPRFGPPVIMG